MIASHIAAELPFMATEVILMQGVRAGGDRQVLHEAIREHSMLAGRRVKEEGEKNDLLERISKDPLFASVHPILNDLMDPSRFIGRSPQQVEEFMIEVVNPILEAHKNEVGKTKIDGVNV